MLSPTKVLLTSKCDSEQVDDLADKVIELYAAYLQFVDRESYL